MTSESKTWADAMLAAGGRKLRAFLRRRVRNAADVPDLAQEVYLRLLRIPDPAAVANPEAYVFAVAGNLVKEHAVMTKRAGQSVSPDDPAVAADLSFLPAFETEADESRQEALLQIALGELPAKCRAAVVMQYRDGLSYAEIAEKLGVSTNMITKYRAQAIAHFRRRLGYPGAARRDSRGNTP